MADEYVDARSRRRFRYVARNMKELRTEFGELRDMLHAMQLEDEKARSDVKIATGNLNNAAKALASTVQVIQARELAEKEKREAKSDGVEKWWPRIVFSLLAIVAALVGVKEILPAIIRLLTGTP